MPGAQHIAWLQHEAHERLLLANSLIREWTNEQAEILVWDAGRSFKTQQHLFERELANAAVKHPALDQQALEELVSHYVRRPRLDPPPPHCTGGAVDVTLLVAGNDTLLGRFDDFEETGRADYYDRHPPVTSAEREECRWRRLLDAAMKQAGFVGIPEEFWHFEFGTALWSEVTGQPVRFADWIPSQLSPEDRQELLDGMATDCLRAIDDALKGKVLGGNKVLEEPDGEGMEVQEEEGEEVPPEKAQTGKLLDRLLYRGVLPR